MISVTKIKAILISRTQIERYQ